jgi:hypothetical protein
VVDPRLVDFTYPSDVNPAGVIENGMPIEVVAAIARIADDVRRSLDAAPGRLLDCRYACASWARALHSQSVVARTVGGEGVDAEVFSSEYRLVPLDRRSGYREADGAVHRHYWLEIERRIFDPTAHQFDSKGGVSLDRYTVEGNPLRSTYE